MSDEERRELRRQHKALAESAHERGDIPEANYQYGWADALAVEDCPHDSLSGDEGPVALLGHMPVRWRCDACEAIVYDDVNQEAM